MEYLIRPLFINSEVTESENTRDTLYDSYCVNKLDGDTFQLIYQNIDKYKRKGKKLLAKLKCTNYRNKYFVEAELAHSLSVEVIKLL